MDFVTFYVILRLEEREGRKIRELKALLMYTSKKKKDIKEDRLCNNIIQKQVVLIKREEMIVSELTLSGPALGQAYHK